MNARMHERTSERANGRWYGMALHGLWFYYVRACVFICVYVCIYVRACVYMYVYAQSMHSYLSTRHALFYFFLSIPYTAVDPIPIRALDLDFYCVLPTSLRYLFGG